MVGHDARQKTLLSRLQFLLQPALHLLYHLALEARPLLAYLVRENGPLRPFGFGLVLVTFIGGGVKDHLSLEVQQDLLEFCEQDGCHDVHIVKQSDDTDYIHVVIELASSLV